MVSLENWQTDGLTDLIREKCDVIDILSKADSHKIYEKWLEIFAFKVKLETGKWKLRNYLWDSCFKNNSYPHYQGNKALVFYKNEDLGTFYIFVESGSQCYRCKSKTHPEFLDSSCDLYIVPEDFNWTAVFTHHHDCYFAFKPDKRVWGEMVDGVFFP